MILFDDLDGCVRDGTAAASFVADDLILKARD